MIIIPMAYYGKSAFANFMEESYWLVLLAILALSYAAFCFIEAHKFRKENQAARSDFYFLCGGVIVVTVVLGAFQIVLAYM